MNGSGPRDEDFQNAVLVEQATIQRFAACYAEQNAYERIAARARGLRALATFVTFADEASGEDAGEVDRSVYESLIQFMSLVGQDMQRDALQLDGERDKS